MILSSLWMLDHLDHPFRVLFNQTILDWEESSFSSSVETNVEPLYQNNVPTDAKFEVKVL